MCVCNQVSSPKAYLHVTQACHRPGPRYCLLRRAAGNDNANDLACRCGAGWWDGTSEGKADSGICVSGRCFADLELVGYPPENDLAFPDWEVGDVEAAPQEECGVELPSVSNTGFHGVKYGIHNILLGKPHRSLHPCPSHNTWCHVGTKS